MPRRNRTNFDFALKTIDVLKDIELVLTPLNPTPQMIEAGCAALDISPMQARLVYEAMVRAGLPEPDDYEDGLI